MSEVVALRPFLRPQTIEIIIRQQVSISNLPGAHVNSCNAHGISRFGCSQNHVAVWHVELYGSGGAASLELPLDKARHINPKYWADAGLL